MADFVIGAMADYVIGTMTDSMMGAMNWLMRRKSKRKPAIENQTGDNAREVIDYNEGEETGDSSGEEILFPGRMSMPNLPELTYVTEMKKDTKEVEENETFVSELSEFEEEIVTSADEVSIRTGENIKKDEGDSHSLRAESTIGKGGGTLDIKNTDVHLEIPPGALQCDYVIQMRIIPHHHLDETELSFASNSSLVVELLPNDVKLMKPVKLTLPHCLLLKENCEWKAKVYSSHHKEGNQPQWEEERNTKCDVTYENCVMSLNNFCWIKVKIGDHQVKAKKIVLFVAKDYSSTKNLTCLDIGYYWHLSSCQQVVKMNRVIVLKEMPALFFKKGHLPLTVLFEKVVPPNWTYNEAKNKKEISFDTIAITEGSFCTFLLNKMASDETDGYACYFKAGQGSDLKDLIFPLTESSLSRTEATIPSMGIATAGDTHEEHPSAIEKTEEIAVSDEHLQKLSKKVGNDWKDVGRNLKLTEGQLENLEQTNHPTLQEKIYQMLLVWKRKRASAGNYVVLGDALKRAGRVDLQEDLLKKYQPT